MKNERWSKSPRIASSDGRKGRKASPWNKSPIVRSAANRERMESWGNAEEAATECMEAPQRGAAGSVGGQ